MQAVILAAGRGTRLHPITLMRSKAMLPVLGKPIVARIVEALTSISIQNFILVISPFDQEIRPYFHQHLIPDVEIQFVEQPEARGMAHALSLVEPWVNGDFILTACDSLLSVTDYFRLISKWNEGKKPAALLALQQVNPKQVSQTAIVQIEEGLITQIVEKPAPHQVTSNSASLPIYLFDKCIFSQLPQLKPSRRGELELQDAIQALIESHKQVRGEFVSERMNLTSAQDLLEINLHFLRAEMPQIILGNVQIDDHVTLKPPYYIGADTTIRSQAFVGPHVYAESGVYFGQGCHVSDSVCLRDAKLDENQIINKAIIYSGKKQ